MGVSTRHLGHSCRQQALTEAFGILSRRLRRVSAHAAARGAEGVGAVAGEGRGWGCQPGIWDTAAGNRHSP